MSQKYDSENDIWEYKPLKKRKKKRDSYSVAGTVAKTKCNSGTPVKRENQSSSRKKPTVKGSPTVNDANAHGCKEEYTCVPTHNLPSSSEASKVGETLGDFCPICQMPFSILVVQSQRWHVAECLDSPRDTCKECPDGLHCSSSFPNHYKRFNHTLLAHTRANSDTNLLDLSPQAETSEKTRQSNILKLIKTEVGDSTPETSQDSGHVISTLTNNSVSPVNNSRAPQAKLTNGLLLLRSPGPNDLKKKKAKASSGKGQKSIISSQERRTHLSSTPLKAHSVDQICHDIAKNESCLYNNEAIAYSPISELHTDIELTEGEPRKSLFKDKSFENDAEKSVELFSDRFSSEDEILTEFIDNPETSDVKVKVPLLSNHQLEPVSSLANTKASSFVGKLPADDSTGKRDSKLQSPQRIVLEHLRDTLLSSDYMHVNNFNDSSLLSDQVVNQSSQQQQQSSLQSSVIPGSQNKGPMKFQSSTGQNSHLKQTDIGVFFGLKPLKEKEKEVPSGPTEVHGSCTSARGQNSRQRTERRRKTVAVADTGQDGLTGPNSIAEDGKGDTISGGSKQWRRHRWNRGNTEGSPRCPFYKKVPGTKFAIDAFRYGLIEGITTYFLTHFHSDHYGGLTKNSTFPIYCNRITGNLVKSKLKVAYQYVHILPMNTPVTVEGTQVTLLDANHCPGAAMLLFFLPDGQTVLHTGDFRADPSMEAYPELLNCRVQTLYLDTTYCSPEYTFPRQEEVINIAASTALELVTLHPRTLVVCGSYSVGKEKVFLALAEVLGSKVSLSRDKFNTMCCLESERVRQHITTNWKEAGVHVLPMMQLTVKKLKDHLARFSGQYDKLVAFKPTGWTFSQPLESAEIIRPEVSGNISIYGIPYSEHSSFLELKRFVQWLQPLKIIPTVNNGCWQNRKAMEKFFSEWLMEAKR